MRSKEGLGPPIVVDWIRSIPDQCLGREIEVPRPRDRPAARTDPAEQRVIGSEAVEDRAPQESFDITLHDAAIGQRQPEAPTVERRGGSYAKHRMMLAQRLDRHQRQT